MSQNVPVPAAPNLDAAFVSRFLAGMPPDLAARFDARLLFAVQQAVGPWSGTERRRGRHLRIRLPHGTWRISLAREHGSAPSRVRAMAAAGGMLCGAAMVVVAVVLLRL